MIEPVVDPTSDRQAQLDRLASRREQDVWVTRDIMEGRLSSRVDVWGTRPEATRFEDGGVLWYGQLPGTDADTSLITRWTVARCIHEFGTAPEDARQVLAVQGRAR